jgi:hypothetical protein
MPMFYEELDDKTRSLMLKEFEAELASGHPYISKGLNDKGWAAFPDLMRAVIETGTEVPLINSLNDSGLWKPTEIHTKNGVITEKPRNISESSGCLGLGEFSTWYVRGLSRRLLDEGEMQCQIYRGEAPRYEPCECSIYVGAVVSAQLFYDIHRARYWPEPGNKDALSVPFEPWCHHVIRTIKAKR